MEPSNPTNGQPFIYRIMDAFGVKHQVVPVNHTHRDLVGQTVSIVINGHEIELEVSDIPNILRAISDPDSMPTANSDKLVTSGGVKAALDGKQGTLTFDTTPTAGSNNPVTSGGVKTALDGKQDALTFDSAPTAGSNNPVTSGGVEKAIIPTIVFSSELDSLYAGSSGTHDTYIVWGDPHLGECILFLSYTQGRFITFYQTLWGPTGVKTRSARESEEYGEWSIRYYTMSEQ